MLLMKLQQDSAAAKKKAAAIAALRRICTPKGKSGHLEVSKDIQARFQKRGAARDELLDVYMECGCDKAGFGTRAMCTAPQAQPSKNSKYFDHGAGEVLEANYSAVSQEQQELFQDKGWILYGDHDEGQAWFQCVQS